MNFRQTIIIATFFVVFLTLAFVNRERITFGKSLIEAPFVELPVIISADYFIHNIITTNPGANQIYWDGQARYTIHNPYREEARILLPPIRTAYSRDSSTSFSTSIEEWDPDKIEIISLPKGESHEFSIPMGGMVSGREARQLLKGVSVTSGQDVFVFGAPLDDHHDFVVGTVVTQPIRYHRNANQNEPDLPDQNP